MGGEICKEALPAQVVQGVTGKEWHGWTRRRLGLPSSFLRKPANNRQLGASLSQLEPPLTSPTFARQAGQGGKVFRMFCSKTCLRAWQGVRVEVPQVLIFDFKSNTNTQNENMIFFEDGIQSKYNFHFAMHSKEAKITRACCQASGFQIKEATPFCVCLVPESQA